MSLFEELKRRNVFKVSLAYIVMAWLLLQVADVILNNVAAPAWVFQVIMLVLAIGFPVIALFAWAFEMTPEGLKRESEVDRSQSITPQTGRKLDFVVIGVMALALVYFGWDKFVRGSGSMSPATVQSTGAPVDGKSHLAPVEPDKSIAVLPFVNMSSDPEQAYFADGISEEILNALAKVGGLKVAGRTSSFAFKGKNEDLVAIGKVLRVNHILEGSVRKSGNRVRITAQLIKVEDGFHMWSETYDRELDDIFAIQDEISAAILVQLKTQLLGDKHLTSTPTDTRAYELYLLAKQRIYDRTEASMKMAVKLLNEANTIDPGYAPAVAQLGIANLFLSEQNYGTTPHLQAGKVAKGYLEKALQLAPQNAEALAGMGIYYLSSERDFEKAIRLLRQALAINPNLVNANAWLANGLDRTGQLQASLQLREQTFQRDPLHRPTFGNLQRSYAKLGQAEKALEMLARLEVYLPGDEDLSGDFGQVYSMSGELAEAGEHLGQAYDNEPQNAVTRRWYGFVLFAARQYEQMAAVAPDDLATLALSRLGRPEEALIMGERAIGTGKNPAWYFQALVENGRFEKLVETLESRWSSLDEFSSDWPGRAGFGYGAMASIAYAYRALGKEKKFEDAVLRFKAALDGQMAEGADNYVLSLSNAQYSMFTGDDATAIDWLEKAFKQGAYLDTNSAIAEPVFKPLNGNPRYEAAKAAMNERLQSELEKMEEAQET